MTDTNNILNKAFYNLLANKTKRLKGYEHTHTHIYTDKQGNFLYAKPRLKNPNTGDKWIRSLSLDGFGKWQIKEPNFTTAYPQGKGKKPLYNLPAIANAKDNAKDNEVIYIFEGEQKADLANRLGLIATTTGGATTISKHYLQPLAGKPIMLWCDNDKAGIQWLEAMTNELNALNCTVNIIDVDKLGLNEKDDIVDWADRLYADGEDDLGVLQAIKNLPTFSDKQVFALITDHQPNTPIITHKPTGEPIEPPFSYENGQFEHYSNGLFFIVYDDEGNAKTTTKICSSLRVLARSCDSNSTAWGIVLQWQDRANNPHLWAMPIYYLQGDSREYRKELVDKGLVVNTNSRSQKLLDGYLNNHPTKEIALCVDKLGWHDDIYVLPNESIGNSERLTVYQPPRIINHGYSTQGTLEQWKSELSSHLAEQSRFVFAISCAFAGQLLSPLNYESGGFHIIGNSSAGKSTSLLVSGSVWGKPKDFIKRWNATKNGLEGVASVHNDGFLGLDEIGEIDPKEIGKAVYMLANGQGKSRSTVSGINRPISTWRVMFLSNGEEDLTSYMKQAGEKTNAGLLVRLCHIDNDVGKGLGNFDSLVLADKAEEQASLIKSLAGRYYGVAGIAWLNYLASDIEAITIKAKQLIKSFMSDYSQLKGQANRVAQRFALVATAGELATQANITGWQAGQATIGVKSCLDNWIDNNGTDGNHESKQIIEHIQKVIDKYSWKFQDIKLKHEPTQTMGERLGLFDKETNQYYFYTSAFSDVCNPFSKKQVLSILDNQKLLIKNNGNRPSYRLRVDKDNIKSFYCVNGDILNSEMAI